MSEFELIELLEKHYDIEDVIIIVNEIIEKVDTNPNKFIVNLSEEIEFVSLSRNRCPLCGSELRIIKHTEDRGEYQGTPCEETIYTRECSECTYVAE